MFVRQLCRLRPAVARTFAARPRHSANLPSEFRALNRLMDDFFSQPMFLSRPFAPFFRHSEMFGEAQSRLRLHEEDGKLIAQMGLPGNVKPEDVKITLKDDRLCVSFRCETKKDNFSSVSEFHEELKLDRVDLEKMEALVDTQDGILRIEAPLKEVAPEDQSQSNGRVKLKIERNDDTKKTES